jgi:hypothetical protein
MAGAGRSWPYARRGAALRVTRELWQG